MLYQATFEMGFTFSNSWWCHLQGWNGRQPSRFNRSGMRQVLYLPDLWGQLASWHIDHERGTLQDILGRPMLMSTAKRQQRRVEGHHGDPTLGCNVGGAISVAGRDKNNLSEQMRRMPGVLIEGEGHF